MTSGKVLVGHPVDVASGAQFTACHDVEVPGSIPLVWRRFYSTKLLPRPSSILGPGWVHFFEMSLRRHLEGFRFCGHDGDEIDFEVNPGSLEAGQPIVNPGHFMELRLERDLYAVYHWHDWQTDVRKFLFRKTGEESMLLHAVELPSGHRLGMEYDNLARPSKILQSVEGRGLRLEYRKEGLLDRLWLTAPNTGDNLCAKYEYDDRGRLIAVTNPSGKAIRYDYDDHDRLTSETSRFGGAYTMKYDPKGRCIEVGGRGQYKLRRLQFDEPGRVTKVTDSLGNVTIYQLNEQGQVELETLPNGATRTTKFDQYGRILAKTEPLGKATKHRYNEQGDLVETIYANGASTKFTFNEYHQPTSVEQPNKGIWRLQYERGALSAIIDPVEAVTRYVRDERNLISTILTPSGNSIKLDRDVHWSWESYSDDFGLIRRCRYDNRLNITEIDDSEGLRDRYTYDASGWMTGIADAAGGLQQFVRGPDGEIMKFVDATGNSTTYEYDPYGNLIRVTDPNGLVHRYVFDTEARLLEIFNPKNEIASFEYDAVGNILRTTSFDGRVDSYEYDARRCRTKWIKPNGIVLRFSHDVLHHLLAISSDEAELVGYEYDVAGHMLAAKTPQSIVTFEYDARGRLAAEVQNGQRVEYKYHAFGDIARRTFEGAKNRPLLFHYDRRGRMVSIEEESKPLERYEYDSRDLLVKRDLGACSETREYDVRELLKSQTVRRVGGGIIVSRSFNHDADGRLTRIADSLRGDVRYVYDPGEQLLLSVGSRRGESRYEYDQCGNLLQNAAGDRLVYESGNRLVRNGSKTYERDANGNLTAISSQNGVTRFKWNALDQLVEVVDHAGAPTVFGYDATGRRTFRDSKGQKTMFYWAGDDLLSEQSAGNVTDYVIGFFAPQMIWENGQLRHVICSDQPVPQEMVDEHGEIVWWGEYGDWGELRHELRAGGSNRLRLPGQYADSEGSAHYNRFRYYQPADGRFISPDPLGLQAGSNEFLYAPNTIGWVDALGLECGKKGCEKNSVYVLTKGEPPEIVYVGITAQKVEDRLAQHAAGPKDFDNMVVIKTGLTRRQARNIEGSALYHIGEGNVVSANTGKPLNLSNAERSDGMPYHSYPPNPKSPRTLYTPAESSDQLNNEVRTLPNPRQ